MKVRAILGFAGGAALVAGILPAQSRAATINYNFNDGTFQGWTNVNTSASPALAFAVTNLSGGGRPVAEGTHHVNPDPFDNRDGTHDLNLVRSPAFYLDGSGPLTILLGGGEGAGFDQAVLPTTPTALAARTDAATGVKAMGIGVRRVSDNAYVATAQKAGEGDTYQTVTIDQATLAGFASPTEQYTLDVFDSYSGGWGWLAFDNATIPGTTVPEPTGLALVGTIAAAGLLRRRRGR